MSLQRPNKAVLALPLYPGKRKSMETFWLLIWPFSKICLKLLCTQLLVEQQATKSPSCIIPLTCKEGINWL